MFFAAYCQSWGEYENIVNEYQFQILNNSSVTNQICQSCFSTFREPGNGVFVVHVCVWWAVLHGSVKLVCKLKVQDEHDDQTILILHWNHIYNAWQTHACLKRRKTFKVQLWVWMVQLFLQISNIMLWWSGDRTPLYSWKYIYFLIVMPPLEGTTQH